MKYWLLKTEPSAFSIDDLESKGVTSWDGVRNYQARNFMRDSMEVGDSVLIYHSGEHPGIVGEGSVISEPYPDPTQFDPTSNYYDSKASKEKPRWFLVDIRFIAKYARPLPLFELKSMTNLRNMVLLKRGMRLSIQPVEPSEWNVIQKLIKN